MSDYQPRFQPGNAITMTAGSGGVTGGQLVTTAGVVAGAGATDVAGVADRDAAQGVSFGALRGGLHQLVAGTGGLTKGQPVKAGAAGTAVLWVSGTDAAGILIGRAWSTAIATALADVVLFGV